MSVQLYEKNQGGVGFTFSQPASHIEYWLNCWQGDKPLLDLGCGHGVNTFEALKHGARVVATDIESPPLDPHPLLTCNTARLPDEMPFAENSFSGILCAEVFHFLTNEQILPAIKTLHSLLEHDGFLILTCVSCEVAVLKETNLQQKAKTAWQTNPDLFQGQHNYIDLLEQAAHLFNQPEITDAMVENHHRNVPDKYFNFFIPEQLAKAIANQGFEVLICELGSAPHYPVWIHGDRDQVRIVAKKPNRKY